MTIKFFRDLFIYEGQTTQFYIENCVSHYLKNEDDLKNEDNLRNENDLKNEDNRKNEDNLKNENDLKNEDDLQKIIAPPPLKRILPEFFFDDLSPQ